MADREGAVTFKGQPLTLTGEAPALGAPAPDFTVLDNELNEVKLSEQRGKKVVLVAVPSLDTGVCDIEAQRFNKEAASLGSDVAVLVISMDLPFAQARWCGATGAENVQTLSDHRDASFGRAYGLLIKELRLLARTVLIVDAEGVLRYRQLVEEVTNEPDYEAVLTALGEL